MRNIYTQVATTSRHPFVCKFSKDGKNERGAALLPLLEGAQNSSPGVNLITCILTMLQHLGGPADLGTVPPRVSQLPDHKQLAHEHMCAVQATMVHTLPLLILLTHKPEGPTPTTPGQARPSQGSPHIPEPPPSNQSTLSWLRVLTLIIPPILRTPR